MDERIARDDVIDVLTGLGLLPVSAQRAADDPRIVWTEEAILACIHDVENSRTGSPAGALWMSYLLHGRLPVLPKVKPIPDKAAPLTSCPIGGPPCFGDLSICHGIHGFVATIECWQCHKPMNVCQGTCKPMVPAVRRTTRNRKEEAA